MVIDMKCSEITLREAIKKLNTFAPIKIIFNNIVLYNDYDEDMIEIEEGVWGENKLPIEVIPNRIWQFDKYIVFDIKIEIVDHHHSVVAMQGEYRNDE